MTEPLTQRQRAKIKKHMELVRAMCYADRGWDAALNADKTDATSYEDAWQAAKNAVEASAEALLRCIPA